MLATEMISAVAFNYECTEWETTNMYGFSFKWKVTGSQCPSTYKEVKGAIRQVGPLMIWINFNASMEKNYFSYKLWHEMIHC